MIWLSLPSPQTLEFYDTTETKIVLWNLWSCCLIQLPFLWNRKRGHKIPEIKYFFSNTSSLTSYTLYTENLNGGLGSKNIK